MTNAATAVGPRPSTRVIPLFLETTPTPIGPFVIILDSRVQLAFPTRASKQTIVRGQQSLDLRAHFSEMDILAGETSNPISLSDQFPVAAAVPGKLEVVLVVGVAVQFQDQAAVNQQIHLSHAGNVHTILEGDPRIVQLQASQSL